MPARGRVSCSNGTWELWPGGQRNVVEAVLQRHDPAVEQLLGAARLPAEVVAEEDAAAGLHRQGRLVVRPSAELQVEHGQVRLAAD
jgi:hypothetical protein